MSDIIIPAPKVGEQDASTLLWNGGYVLPAAANYIVAFILLIMAYVFTRRLKANNTRKIDNIMRMASLPAVTTMCLAFLWLATACALIYSGVFGPANLVSLHVDPAAVGIDITQFYVQNALPKIGTSQYNFFPWIYPMIATLLSEAFVFMAAGYFNKFEDYAAGVVGVTAIIVGILNLLTYTHINTTGWYLYIVGAMCLTIFDSVMIYMSREVIGIPTGIAAAVPFITQVVITVQLAVGSYSTAKYTMDVTMIWLQSTLGAWYILVTLFFMFAAYYTVAKVGAEKTKENKKPVSASYPNAISSKAVMINPSGSAVLRG